MPGLSADGAASALGEGWHLPESHAARGDRIPFRWTGSRAEATIHCNGRGQRLVIETLMAHPSGSSRVEVVVNGERAGVLVVPNRPGRHALPLDKASFNGRLTVELRTLDTFRPRDVLRGSSDDRILGVAVSRIALE